MKTTLLVLVLLLLPIQEPDTLRVEGPAEASTEGDNLKQIVSGGVINGKAIKKPLPDYPSSAKASRVQGRVGVQIVVDEQGNVISAVAVSGHPMRQGASVESARRAKFEPALSCGQPVRVSGIVTYNFVLQ